MTKEQELQIYSQSTWSESVEEEISPEVQESMDIGKKAIRERFGPYASNIILGKEKEIRMHRLGVFPDWLRGIVVVGEEPKDVTPMSSENNVSLTFVYPDLYKHIVSIDLEQQPRIYGRNNEEIKAVEFAEGPLFFRKLRNPFIIQLSPKLAKFDSQELNVKEALIVVFSPNISDSLWSLERSGKDIPSSSFPTNFVYITEAEVVGID